VVVVVAAVLDVVIVFDVVFVFDVLGMEVVVGVPGLQLVVARLARHRADLAPALCVVLG